MPGPRDLRDRRIARIRGAASLPVSLAKGVREVCPEQVDNRGIRILDDTAQEQLILPEEV